MKAFTDIEQSKKLAEILPLKSADMRIGNYVGDDNKKVALFSVCLKNDKNLENARSMQRNLKKPEIWIVSLNVLQIRTVLQPSIF